MTDNKNKSDRSNGPLAFPEDINWELLKRFMICASSENFREAKNKIGTSASALSKQMDELEILLDVQLFEKVQQNRTCNLTEHGELYLKYLKDIYYHLQNLFTVMRKGAEENKAIKLVTTPGLAEYVLPKIILEFNSKFSTVNISLETILHSREVKPEEIMILSGLIPQKDIIKKYLFSHKMGLYATHDYIKKYGRPKNFEDLVNHINLALEGDSTRNVNKGTIFLKKLKLFPRFSSDSFNFLTELCLSGKGVLEMPDFFNDSDNFKKVLDGGPQTTRDIYMAFHPKLISYKHNANFIELLENFFKVNNRIKYDVNKRCK